MKKTGNKDANQFYEVRTVKEINKYKELFNSKFTDEQFVKASDAIYSSLDQLEVTKECATSYLRDLANLNKHIDRIESDREHCINTLKDIQAGIVKKEARLMKEIIHFNSLYNKAIKKAPKVKRKKKTTVAPVKKIITRHDLDKYDDEMRNQVTL